MFVMCSCHYQVWDSTGSSTPVSRSLGGSFILQIAWKCSSRLSTIASRTSARDREKRNSSGSRLLSELRTNFRNARYICFRGQQLPPLKRRPFTTCSIIPCSENCRHSSVLMTSTSSSQ